ncbi:MAG: hypothetical protein AAGD28_20270 [Bacteroidota bacterium]
MRRYQKILILLFFLYQQSLYSQQLDSQLPLAIMDGFPEFGSYEYEEVEPKTLHKEGKKKIREKISAISLRLRSKFSNWHRELFLKRRKVFPIGIGGHSGNNGEVGASQSSINSPASSKKSLSASSGVRHCPPINTHQMDAMLSQGFLDKTKQAFCTSDQPTIAGAKHRHLGELTDLDIPHLNAQSQSYGTSLQLRLFASPDSLKVNLLDRQCLSVQPFLESRGLFAADDEGFLGRRIHFQA